MNQLKYYPEMMQVLETNLPRYLFSNVSRSILDCQLETLTPILLVGSSHQVSFTFINRLICKQNNIEKVPSLDVIQEHVKENAYMFCIDMISLVQVDFIYNICQQKSHVGKHVIVMNIVDQIKPNFALAIKSIINQCIESCVFILVNNKGVNVSSALKEICLVASLKIDHDMFTNDFFRLINMDVCVFNQTDPLNICMLAEHPNVSIDYLEKFVKLNMDNIIACKTLESYGKSLRIFCIKIGASAIPISNVVIEIINYIGPRMNAEIMQLLTDMEYETKKTNKYLFALEYKIDCVVNLFIERNCK
jgi:hypothetical protein